jgi:N utilization substance protein A
MRGMRIQNIVTELAGEKIDVVEWSSNLRTYISNALGPAKVQSVLLEEGSNIKTAIVIVPDRQLSLAIGKAGQNARLAAKLTGWRIDIKSESEARAEGLDLLAAEQAQMAAGEQDLLSMAEKILRDRDESTTREDTFRQAAALLQKQDAASRVTDQGTAAEWPDSLPAQDDERGIGVDAGEALSAFERAAAAVRNEEPPIVPLDEFAIAESKPLGLSETSDDDGVPEKRVEESEQPAPQASELAQESTEEERMLRAEELPQVITADMLRQRMAARQQGRSADAPFGSPDDMEVPAELLEPLKTAEEVDDEVGEEDSKARRGSQTTPKKQPKRSKARRPRGRDTSFGED